ncbi:hypothetical protein ACWDCZ_00005, partial [Kitasatospora sp. NPDC001225]
LVATGGRHVRHGGGHRHLDAQDVPRGVGGAAPVGVPPAGVAPTGVPPAGVWPGLRVPRAGVGCPLAYVVGCEKPAWPLGGAGVCPP